MMITFNDEVRFSLAMPLVMIIMQEPIVREAKARLQEKYQTAQQLGQEVKIYKCSQKAGSSLYESRLRIFFGAGPFAESCLGHKTGQRQSGHLACSFGGG